MANPTAQTPHMNSRPKRPPAGDEEAAATLRLGEFQDVPTLSLSEARTIVTAVVGRRKANKAQVADSETLVKTQEYLELFARFKEEDSVHAVANLLTARRELDSFEKSQLGSLCPDTAEEAKTLIPSLEGKISDDDLQEVLNEIARLQKFLQ